MPHFDNTRSGLINSLSDSGILDMIMIINLILDYASPIQFSKSLLLKLQLVLLIDLHQIGIERINKINNKKFN